jgi:phage terminase small subunit
MPAPRKSLKVLALHGTYRKDRHGNRHPPEVSLAKDPAPPAWLQDEARTLFLTLSGQLIEAGILSELDLELLALYCALHGRVVESLAEGGTIRPSMIAVLRGLAADLGMTPASRQRLSVKPVQTEVNEFDGI